ncbi:MAG: ATP-binding protein [Allomuricauda sp.]
MKFKDIHNVFFGTKTGAFSTVTERENFDSQITVTRDEKKIILDFFGSENILKGSKSNNPELAIKTFLLYPEMIPISLNLVFPKPGKTELRLYLSSEHGFKPKGGDIWFIYLNENDKLVIGSLPKSDWNSLEFDLNIKNKLEKKSSAEIELLIDQSIDPVQRHSFKPGAMSIIQMGEELIGHPSTAVNELVKNGYDADAELVKVYFHNSRQRKKSFIIISDDGTGMDYKTLFGDWLQPSVSSKRKDNKCSTKFNRHFLGSKGIGRLAAMALGEKVTVISKTEGETKYNWITVDREKFKEETLLSKVTFPGDTIDEVEDLFRVKGYLTERNCDNNVELINLLLGNDLNSFQKGTLIVIEGMDAAVKKILNNDFRQSKIAGFEKVNVEFYKSLATLLTPISLNEQIQQELLVKRIINKKIIIADSSSSFQVKFGSNQLTKADEFVINWLEVEPISILSIFDYRVYGKVTSDGEVDAYISYQRLANDHYDEPLKISAEEINEILRPRFGQQLLIDGMEDKNETGEYYFDIRIYDIGEKDNLTKLAQDAGFSSNSEFKSAFKNFQGLRVSKNGFGVKPYGDEVEDWIGLSKARVQDPGHNVNTNQILGYVFFYSPENDSLEEKTNREGFLENRSFIQVKNTLSVLFKNLGRRRYNYRLLIGIGRIPSSKHERPDIEEFLSEINSTSSIEQIRKNSEKFMREVTTSMDNLENSLSFSERLASLGSGIELVYHEMAQPTGSLKIVKSSLEFKKSKIEIDTLESFITDIRTLDHATEVLKELRSSLQPAIGQSRKAKFRPIQTFFKVCNLYKSDIEEYGIKIIADERLNNYEIMDHEYAFWISFLNIVNNAVYWIKKAGKKAEIRFHYENESLVLSNSGPLINEQLLGHIFNYGVTTRQEKNATGLGLAFTQSILSKNNWRIQVENRKDGPAFIITKSKDE